MDNKSPSDVHKGTSQDNKKRAWRLAALAILALLAVSSPELSQIVLASISDAYLQVTVFVAGTLFLVYLFENRCGFDLGQTMAKADWMQMPIASGLGAMPGCGGAIIVITHYTKGHVSFGGVVAVLIATMGDAAFLLLSQKPLTALSIMMLGFVVGTLSGWVVDLVHGKKFMRPEPLKVEELLQDTENSCEEQNKTPQYLFFTKLWKLWVLPSGAIGLLLAFQYKTDNLFGQLASLEPTHWIGVVGGVISLTMWAWQGSPQTETNPTATASLPKIINRRVIEDTNFVTSWVVLGFLTYEMAVYFTGSSIENWLRVWTPFVPFIAILIGFIPGCGPQIVTTSLYLTGTIPLSAQLGNAISNDGDALFPALALAPRAAIYATLYSAIPAIFIAFGYHIFAEMPH